MLTITSRVVFDVESLDTDTDTAVLTCVAVLISVIVLLSLSVLTCVIVLLSLSVLTCIAVSISDKPLEDIWCAVDAEGHGQYSHLCRPMGVLTAVRKDEASSTLIWRNTDFASNLVNTFASGISTIMSSTVRIG